MVRCPLQRSDLPHATDNGPLTDRSMQFTKMHGAGNDYIYVDCFAAAGAATIFRSLRGGCRIGALASAATG